MVVEDPHNPFVYPSGPFEVTSAKKITQVDEVSSTITYVGKADPGTATSSALWAIQRIDTSVSPLTKILYAGGSSAETNIWDNRAALVYS